MKPIRLTCTSVVAALAVLVQHGLAQDAPSLTERQKRWQEELELREFEFPEDASWVVQSFGELPESIETHIVIRPKERGNLEFRFLMDGRQTLTLTGRAQSAFAYHDGLLFFADYYPIASGCTIRAYDLKTGKEQWKTELHHQQPLGHSAYGNAVTMWLSAAKEVKDEVEGASLIITGSESYCDYVEVLDSGTGESLAQKNYRVGF